MTSRTRFGIVGCGAVVQEYHLPAIVQNPLIDLRVLCDNNTGNATTARKLFRLAATTTTGINDLPGQVDAVLVAAPPRFHAPISIPLLEAGIDVLCEKPLATSAAEADAMVDAAQRHGRILAAAMPQRFHPNNATLRKLVRGSALGDIREVVAESGAPLDWTMTTDSYYNRASSGGGVLFDTGVHVIDRVLWLLGDISGIECEDDSYGGVESNTALRGRLTINGRQVPCRMAFSWTHALDNSIRIEGANGTATARFKEPGIVRLQQLIAGEPMEMLIPSATADTNFFRAEISDFINAVRQRGEPLATGRSAAAAIKLIEKAYAVRRRMPQPWVET